MSRKFCNIAAVAIATLISVSMHHCTPSMNQSSSLEHILDSSFATVFSEDAPGGSIFIQQGNNVLYEKSFGLSDMNTKSPFTASTFQNIGSVSKTFVAYGILQLEEQGLLSLEDPISKYFPDFSNADIADQVTIRHLLTHTSGLPDLRKTSAEREFYLTAKDQENWDPIKQADSLHFTPGSRYEYSNPAYNGLALIIEKVSGKKWQEYIKEHIFIPSDMHGSDIQDGAHPEKNVAHGYRLVNGKWEEYDYGEYPTFAAAGNGGVWSSVADLRKYVKAVKENKFVQDSTNQKAIAPWESANWKEAVKPWKGFVWFNHKSYKHGVEAEDKTFQESDGEQAYTVIEHSGDQGGFRAHVLMLPEPDITIIWLTNNEALLSESIWKALKQAGYIK